MLFLSEWSTDISHKSNMALHKFIPTSTFPFLQMDPPPNKMFKPEACRFFVGFFFDTSYSLTSTANSSSYPSDSTPFFQNMGTSLAQVLSHSPEPLKESVSCFISIPHSPTSSLSSFPSPTKSFSSWQPEQCFKSDHATLTQNASGAFLSPSNLKKNSRT